MRVNFCSATRDVRTDSPERDTTDSPSSSSVRYRTKEVPGKSYGPRANRAQCRGLHPAGGVRDSKPFARPTRVNSAAPRWTADFSAATGVLNGAAIGTVFWVAIILAAVFW